MIIIRHKTLAAKAVFCIGTTFLTIMIFFLIGSIVPVYPLTQTVPADNDKLRQQATQLTWFTSPTTDHTIEDSPSETIEELTQNLENLEHDYLDKLEERRSSYGIYAVGKFDNDFANSQTQYGAGLRWKIFNDGYYEAVRNDAKKILQTQLEFYQLRRDMIERKLNDDLFKLFTFDNRINMNYYRERQAALETLLEKRMGQLKHGYTTEIDVLDIRHQLTKAKSSFSFYKDSNWAEIPDSSKTVLNQLEIFHLKPLVVLIDLAEKNSFDLKIQDNFTERSNFFPTWAEDLTVNIDAEHRKEFYEEDRSIIGIEVEVPLFFDRDRKSLIKTQKRIYQYQQQAIRHRLAQQLDKLCSFYRFQQQRLSALLHDTEIILIKIQKAASKEANTIQQLDTDPARNLDLLLLELIDTRYEALRTRLKIYELLLKVMSHTQVAEITSLFEFD